MDPVTFFKCLSDETRLKALLLIQHEKELCVCELMVALGESQPKVSRHLAQLRKAKLLLDRKHKQWVYYRINDALPNWALDTLVQTHGENKSYFSTSLTKLNEMGSRPERVASCCNIELKGE
ncbi:metalloregulator ArsR/SmtB family transcription factor [Pseudoalteromonas sp. MMG013]|uniref:ArsR family transcriptional regulator n=2 Tax=Pseudoalteromonas TaxID=53246 RepID=A0ABR9EC55_9GAMM|nr:MULTISPECIES: metalloregulator ArsR/SmtB family transcription factor [Pseudoalteromonas]MBE0368580.1 ArsR family transcriptional regulator [Pseudoalteromonas aurantia 208]MBQ4851764.1 metalloregulator ArsR/SmtB family transcription factor [Pseudoalteromonas sp. MMG012]MBQ4862754.1 metalloregulator ArsR/SmtB family transcription factor [Pseudoalteromonas sp. MMG013]